MSGVERDNLAKIGDVARRRLTAHIARREPGRRIGENEIEGLVEDIIVIPEERTTEKKKRPASKKIKIISSYPLGWTKIRRF